MEGEDDGVLQLDTAEVVYLNEDPLPELADLVIYTKPIRLPTQGFEVIASSQDHWLPWYLSLQRGMNIKCTEMYSLSEPVLRKVAKRTPRELSLSVKGMREEGEERYICIFHLQNFIVLVQVQY